jgi:hypothetical protein
MGRNTIFATAPHPMPRLPLVSLLHSNFVSDIIRVINSQFGVVLRSNAGTCLKRKGLQLGIDRSVTAIINVADCCKIGAATSMVAKKMQDVESKHMPRPFGAHQKGKEGAFVKDETAVVKLIPLPSSYPALLGELKNRIRAALTLNQETIQLYWSIGQDLSSRFLTEGWGTKVVDRLGKDLGTEFPGVEGFSGIFVTCVPSPMCGPTPEFCSLVQNYLGGTSDGSARPAQRRTQPGMVSTADRCLHLPCHSRTSRNTASRGSIYRRLAKSGRKAVQGTERGPSRTVNGCGTVR